MPAGRAEALPAELVPVPDVPEFVPEPEAPDVDPTVLPVLPVEDVPLALVWLLSRAVLLLTSQHWAPLELEPEPAPCAFAEAARTSSATPDTAARAIFFMKFPLFCAGLSYRRSSMPTFNPCSFALIKIEC